MRKLDLSHLARFLVMVFICTLIIACKSDQSTSNNEATTAVAEDLRALPNWAKNATIYEVNIRQFTQEGDFNAFIKHLPRLKKLGVDILWFMPIYPISKEKRKGSLGSYYAISDYRGINPEFGTMADFDRMVARIHELDMHIILDWVPNHTGWDHPWIKEHPEWYTQNEKGEIIDPTDPKTGKSWGWTDVADLNYSNREMRKAMIDEKLFWLNQHGVDGFREDVAHGVPDDFWDEVAQALYSKERDLFMLAEAEEAAHMNSSNFHMCYGWSAHHLLNEIAQGKKTAADLDVWHKEFKAKFNKGFAMHFTSNHDENTWAGTIFDRLGEAHKALAALTFTFDGMPLIYGGQEEPLKKRLEFFEKDDIEFKTYAYSDFYQKLTSLKDRNQAIWNGVYGGETKKLIQHENVYAFKREKNGDSVIGVFNLSDKSQSITISEDIRGLEVMTKQKTFWKANSKLDLKPWQYYIISSK